MKIFGIGLSRTGTTSLCDALRMLGYRAIHNPRDVVEIAGWCDAATDITVSCRFEMLDKLFPGSKWIYTIRDMDSWLDSCERHFTDEARLSRLSTGYADEATAINATYTESELMIYGQLDFNRDVWRRAYERHDDHVKNYFRGRDILTINLGDMPGATAWQPLMEYVGAAEIPFPKLNVGK